MGYNYDLEGSAGSEILLRPFYPDDVIYPIEAKDIAEMIRLHFQYDKFSEDDLITALELFNKRNETQTPQDN